MHKLATVMARCPILASAACAAIVVFYNISSCLQMTMLRSCVGRHNKQRQSLIHSVGEGKYWTCAKSVQQQ